eukprot:Skav203439  [mRNA]  locus=scaffold1836:287214:287858:- [translate_table: standard]
MFHTILLRSDGSVVACGDNEEGQCDIPTLHEGLSYTDISAGTAHTVLLRSDGDVVACGDNEEGQCNIPLLDQGLSYTQVSAGEFHTVLLRSDGGVVACGDSGEGQCDIPSLEPRLSYVSDMPLDRAVAVQLDFDSSGDAIVLVCSNLAGEEKLRFNVRGSDLAWETHKRLAVELNANLQSLRVVMPDGQLLAKVCHADPGATVAAVIDSCKHAV